MKGSLPGPNEVSKSLVGYKIAYNDNGDKCYDLNDVVSVSVSIYQNNKGLVRKNINLMISAVLEEYGGALFFSPDSTLFISYDAGKKILGFNDWSGIIVLVRDVYEVRNVTNTLRNYFSGNADVISFSAIADSVASVTRVVDFINFTTSLSAFAVAVSGVAATMITSVMERTREIGVMKAIGYTNTLVMILIIMEAILMSLIGAGIGVSLGVVGAYILSGRGLTLSGMMESSTIVIYAPPKISLENILFVILLTISIGILGGILPAYRAAKIPPATALRYE